MKRLLLSFILLMSALVCPNANAVPTQYTWLWIQSTNCAAVTGYPAQTMCFETTDNLIYVCSPNAGPTGTCNTTGEWKLPGSIWVDNGTTVSLKNSRNVNIGAGLFMGSALSGITFNPSGDGVTLPVQMLPTGLIVTQSGVQYTGNNAFWNVNRTADETNPNVGDLYFNTSNLAFVYYNGTALKRLPVLQMYANTFSSPTSNQNIVLLKTPVGLKVESINCITNTGTAPITLQQCNSSDQACSSINTAISCSTTGANDGGGISAPNIPLGDYLNLVVGTTSGSPTSLNLTVVYSQNEP